MRVEKWYLDCVTPDGAGMIGYVARLGVGPLAVRTSELLRWPAGEAAPQGRTVLGGRLPVASAEGVDWDNPVLDVRGRWRPFVPGLPVTLLHEDPAGRIEWTCSCPAARASVSIGGHDCSGFGYAERLRLTLSPALLPLRELLWGRFIAENQSCVWIRWPGPIERSWCWYNGQPVTATMSDPPGLAWPGHRLLMHRGTAIRSGRIAGTSLRGARWLHWLLPDSVLQLDETKWCSAGVLTDALGRRHSGWAVHEVVRFPCNP